MCGKFTQMMSWGEYVTLAEMIGAPASAADTVTPMRFATVICLDAEGRRAARRMRWGLVPPYAADPMMGTKFIHARAETIEEKPTFREAFFNRRGLVVVNTFNEGEEVTPKKTQQYVITPRGRAAVAIAVVWERWTRRDEALETFAMVTVPPNALIATITDRMPALVDDADWPIWLGEVPADVDTIKSVLKTSTIDMDMEKQQKKPPPPRQGDLF
ncbi:MAG: SOS response-associated peptidase [Proteobacteria bacterium]|nr:SOS response-associated peptidase [Pseudomonadota bacterium]